jgi:hypothetical protein
MSIPLFLALLRQVLHEVLLGRNDNFMIAPLRATEEILH